MNGMKKICGKVSRKSPALLGYGTWFSVGGCKVDVCAASVKDLKAMMTKLFGDDWMFDKKAVRRVVVFKAADLTFQAKRASLKGEKP
jgi:hypothetical protein